MQKLQLLSSEQKQVPGDLRRSLDDGCKRQLERLVRGTVQREKGEGW